MSKLSGVSSLRCSPPGLLMMDRVRLGLLVRQLQVPSHLHDHPWARLSGYRDADVFKLASQLRLTGSHGHGPQAQAVSL
jgi:hypothetical protein